MGMRVFVFLLFVLLACGRKLAFHDGIFKIMQITDTHIGDHPDLDVLTKQQLMDLIRFEKPDVVAMTGDLIAGIFFAVGRIRQIGVLSSNCSFYRQ